MPLYTFILDFEGGTYLSQVEASTFKSAPAVWASNLAPGEVRGMREASIRELGAAMAENTPIQLNGLVHAWCVSALVRGRLALVHFVQTCG